MTSPFFIPQEIIRKKREGFPLTQEEISFFVKGLTDGSIVDCQISAFAMAIFFKGLDITELKTLTQSMKNSGTVLNWSHLHGPILDKHSTGGIGDNVSLILAPLIAACGGYVPMISGRGLGHTGGTLDKMDSIKGYQTHPSLSLFKETVQKIGCAIIGQTEDLAPADKKFYAIRDITATVESIHLIIASILSKKMAAGLDGLVMDVKTGNGSFMENLSQAVILAGLLTQVANTSGLRTVSLITDMNQPLAPCAGNALEVKNAIEILQGLHKDTRIYTVTLALAEEMLLVGNIVKNKEEAKKILIQALETGKAAEIFEQMVHNLKGPSNILSTFSHNLPKAPIIRPVYTNTEGFVHNIKTREIGLAVITLGGGRTSPEQSINHSVGIDQILCIGDEITPQTPLAFIHAQNEEDYKKTELLIKNAFVIAPHKDINFSQKMIYKRID